MKISNIYVDELPKSCFECKCAFKAQRQQVNEFGSYMEDCMCCIPLHKWIVEKHRDCPLKPLSDRLAEERKKVAQEIWKEFEQRLMGKTKDMSVMKVCNMINSVLYQIERGE